MVSLQRGVVHHGIGHDFAGEASRIVQKVFPANGQVYDVKDPFAGVKPDWTGTRTGATSTD